MPTPACLYPKPWKATGTAKPAVSRRFWAGSGAVPVRTAGSMPNFFIFYFLILFRYSTNCRVVGVVVVLYYRINK